MAPGLKTQKHPQMSLARCGHSKLRTVTLPRGPVARLTVLTLLVITRSPNRTKIKRIGFTLCLCGTYMSMCACACVCVCSCTCKCLYVYMCVLQCRGLGSTLGVILYLSPELSFIGLTSPIRLCCLARDPPASTSAVLG